MSYRQRNEEIKALKIRGSFVGFVFAIGTNYSLDWNFVRLLTAYFPFLHFFPPIITSKALLADQGITKVVAGT